MQERTKSGLSESFIVHNPVERHLINTHALHNAHLIRATLPRNLTVPIPYICDREEHHKVVATGLRSIQDAKRAKTAANVAAKKAAAGSSEGISIPAKRRRVDNQMNDTSMEE